MNTKTFNQHIQLLLHYLQAQFESQALAFWSQLLLQFQLLYLHQQDLIGWEISELLSHVRDLDLFRLLHDLDHVHVL